MTGLTIQYDCSHISHVTLQLRLYINMHSCPIDQVSFELVGHHVGMCAPLNVVIATTPTREGNVYTLGGHNHIHV